MRSGQGFVLLYSITSQPSLNDLGDVRDQIIRAKGTSDVSFMFVYFDQNFCCRTSSD